MSNTPSHGSDVQETPDWWKASDGRFYPPELHPDYVKPEAPAAPASSTPSLAERLRAEADRVGDEAAAAADAGVGSMDAGARSTVEGARSTVEGAAGDAGGAAAAAAGAAGAAAASAVPEASAVVDPRATIPATPPAATPPAATPPNPQDFSETVIQQVPPAAAPPVGQPPIPGAPPAMPPTPGAPPAMPPSPGAPPAMPPSPQAAAPVVEQGPGGITYTAAPDAAPATLGAVGGALAPGQPPMPGAGVGPAPAPTAPGAASKLASSTAGAVALLAGIAAIAGSLLKWGKGSVVGVDGAEKAIIEVAGFDSNGLLTAICGGVLILCGLLFFMGVPKQINWAVLAFLAGAVIVGTVVFSMIDIGDLSNRYAAQWQDEGLASVGDVISTSADIGLWVAGAGGVLGVLAAPFVNRG